MNDFLLMITIIGFLVFGSSLVSLVYILFNDKKGGESK